jgi:esterase/lipase superfamily enzyme
MMPTPNVLTQEGQDIYGNIAPELKSTEVQLFYITDRKPEQDEEGNLRYGFGRSASVAFGKVVVNLGTDITWDDLLEASRSQQRLKPVKMEVKSLEEILRGPGTPLPYKEVDGKVVEQPDYSVQRARGSEKFRKQLLEQLELTQRNEVFIYIHGYHNTFDDAAFAMAELWHFLGRIGVPIIYSWPAGYPGIFGYTYDRESSEFTVYHLRRAIKYLSSIPEVEKIHLIAHSRGTDVVSAAIRELTIAARAAGENPREKYKIHNLILAAPDLDLDVGMQRLGGDQVLLSAHRVTIYTSPEDKAIGIAAKLFASPRGRAGTFGISEAKGDIKERLEFGNANRAYVNYQGAKGGPKEESDTYGHSYFRNAPTVSSDLVLMLRNDLDPGGPGRPLEPLGLHFWRVPPGYPNTAGKP